RLADAELLAVHRWNEGGGAGPMPCDHEAALTSRRAAMQLLVLDAVGLDLPEPLLEIIVRREDTFVEKGTKK
ncbi:unnamed protein product, partial [marine sediment metagenome]